MSFKQTLSSTYSIALFWLFLLPTLVSNHNSPYQLNDEITPDQKRKAEVAKRVYNDIAQTARDYRQPPIFNFVYQEEGEPLYYNAYYNPKNNGVYMSEALYDLSVSFGADSLNVLALILGHELAHFYKGHGWGMSFGMANEDIQIAQKIYQRQYNSQERAEMEAEADYFGGLFGYLAGYNTLKVGGKFFKKLYGAAQLPDTVKGYPTLAERVQICENSQQKLIEQLPVFHAANWAAVIGEYSTASACYDYLIGVLPSRELYNNAGTVLALEAIEYYSPQELRYAYPFGLDFNTYLDTAYMDHRGGGPELLVDQTEARKQLLTEAKGRFESAIKTDVNYPPAYINMSLTQSLLGDHETAGAQASKAIKLLEQPENTASTYLLANAQIARGIAFALQQNPDEAKKLWDLAIKGNPIYAQANLSVLKDKQFAKSIKDNNSKTQETAFHIEYEYIEKESVISLEALYDMRTGFVTMEIPSAHAHIPSVVVYSFNDKNFDAIVLESQVNGSEQYDAWAILLTTPSYAGKTSKGIRLGSSLQELEAQYGKANQRTSNANGFVLHYPAPDNPHAGLVFEINGQQKVVRWGIYQHWLRGA